MSTHAVLSASGSFRWLNCVGSTTLAEQANLPEPPSSPYAEEGTAAHQLGEECLAGGIEPVNKIGEDITTPEKNTFRVDQEMADAVTVYTDHCWELTMTARQWNIESQLTLDQLTWKHGIDTDAFGTVDFWALCGSGVLYVRDYKHGAGVPIEIENNTQALYYALALLFYIKAAGLPVPKLIDIGIVQPRAPHIEGPIRTRQIDPIDLLMWGDDVLAPGMKRALDPNDNNLTTGPWCRFCPVRTVCPALRKLAVQTAKVEFGGLPPTPQTLSDTELGAVLDQAEVIKVWLQAIQGEASHRIEGGASIPNWKLVQKRAFRSWKEGTTPGQILQTLPQNGVVPVLAEPKLATVAELERRCQRANVDFEPIEQALVQKKSSGTTLAFENDPREAVAKRGSEFDPITEA